MVFLCIELVLDEYLTSGRFVNPCTLADSATAPAPGWAPADTPDAPYNRRQPTSARGSFTACPFPSSSSATSACPTACA